MSEPVELARRAVEIAAEHQASDVVLLEIAGLADFADYFVLASADSVRQIDALLEAVSAGLKEMGASLLHREGASDSGWVLLDYGDVVVHLFGREEREYYRLEEVWRGAVPLIRVQ